MSDSPRKQYDLRNKRPWENVSPPTDPLPDSKSQKINNKSKDDSNVVVPNSEIVLADFGVSLESVDDLSIDSENSDNSDVESNESIKITDDKLVDGTKVVEDSGEVVKDSNKVEDKPVVSEVLKEVVNDPQVNVVDSIPPRDLHDEVRHIELEFNKERDSILEVVEEQKNQLHALMEQIGDLQRTKQIEDDLLVARNLEYDEFLKEKKNFEKKQVVQEEEFKVSKYEKRKAEKKEKKKQEKKKQKKSKKKSIPVPISISDESSSSSSHSFIPINKKKNQKNQKKSKKIQKKKTNKNSYSINSSKDDDIDDVLKKFNYTKSSDESSSESELNAMDTDPFSKAMDLREPNKEFSVRKFNSYKNIYLDAITFLEASIVNKRKNFSLLDVGKKKQLDKQIDSIRELKNVQIDKKNGITSKRSIKTIEDNIKKIDKLIDDLMESLMEENVKISSTELKNVEITNSCGFIADDISLINQKIYNLDSLYNKKFLINSSEIEKIYKNCTKSRESSRSKSKSKSRSKSKSKSESSSKSKSESKSSSSSNPSSSSSSLKKKSKSDSKFVSSSSANLKKKSKSKSKFDSSSSADLKKKSKSKSKFDPKFVSSSSSSSSDDDNEFDVVFKYPKNKDQFTEDNKLKNFLHENNICKKFDYCFFRSPSENDSSIAGIPLNNAGEKISVIRFLSSRNFKVKDLNLKDLDKENDTVIMTGIRNDTGEYKSLTNYLEKQIKKKWDVKSVEFRDSIKNSSWSYAIITPTYVSDVAKIKKLESITFGKNDYILNYDKNDYLRTIKLVPTSSAYQSSYQVQTFLINTIRLVKGKDFIRVMPMQFRTSTYGKKNAFGHKVVCKDQTIMNLTFNKLVNNSLVQQMAPKGYTKDIIQKDTQQE